MTEYGKIVEPYVSAMRMIRQGIEEIFGPIADLESEEATLLRGPEPHHEAEAILDALKRIEKRVGYWKAKEKSE